MFPGFESPSFRKKDKDFDVADWRKFAFRQADTAKDLDSLQGRSLQGVGITKKSPSFRKKDYEEIPVFPQDLSNK